jgi:hypothetical protein
MSNPLLRARQDIERIEAEISKLQAERESIATFIRMYKSYASEGVSFPDDAPIHTPPLKSRLIEATIAFLRERGKPAFMNDIYTMLESKGLIPGGDKPRQQTSGILGRSGRFDFKPETGWWLKGAELLGTIGPDAINLRLTNIQ